MKTIIITGASGSGKTFLTNKLEKDINNTITINTDSYYRDDLFIKCLSLFMKDIYDRVISINNKELHKTIESIYRNDNTITIYKYDFKRRKSSQSTRKRERQNKFLIIEGIFSHRLNLDYKRTINIFCKETKEICFERRLNRDELERGRKKKEVSRKYFKSWYLYYKNLPRYIEKNDINIVSSTDQKSYEKLINKLKEFIS